MNRSIPSFSVTMRMEMLAMLLTLALTTTPLAQNQPLGFSAEDALKQAIIDEEIHNNPQKALKAYSQIIDEFDRQRTLAATALYRLAECHRKLDDRKSAINAFRKLIRQFPEEGSAPKSVKS